MTLGGDEPTGVFALLRHAQHEFTLMAEVLRFGSKSVNKLVKCAWLRK